MDFNPLDLLASAAELQQQHGESPEPIVVTPSRLKKQGLVSAPLNGEKENHDLSIINTSNNNNALKSRVKPNIVIVKKIKAESSSPELEKMFDEHNYGNAKKNNNKHEKNSEETNRDRSINTQSMPYKNEKFETNGCDVSNCVRTNIGVVSNTKCAQSNLKTVWDCDKRTATSSSVGVTQGDESHTTPPCERKSSVNGHVDDVTCLTSDSSVGLQAKLGKCEGLNCSADTCVCAGDLCVKDIGSSDYNTCSINSGNDCSVNSERDKQSRDNNSLNIGMSHTEHGQDGKIVHQSLKGSKPNVAKLHLDDTTGEFITKEGSKMIIKSTIANSVKLSGSQKPVDNTNWALLEKESCCESSNSLNESINTQSLKSTSKGDIEKMPYVKVIPAKELGSDTAIDRSPEMLVINISRSSNSQQNKIPSIASQKSSEQPILETMESRPDNCMESNEKTNSIGILKSIVVSDKVKQENMKNGNFKLKSKPLIFKMVPQKIKYDIPKCSTINEDSKVLSYKSIKVLELSDPVCADESTTSVHLLSPDRRNPDSMGIAESPVAQSDLDMNDNIELENPDKKLFSSPMSTLNKYMPKESVETCSATDLQDLKDSEGDSDTRELMKESRFESIVRPFSCDNISANGTLTPFSGNEVPIFRFDSDHCYAGLPGKLDCSVNIGASETDTALTSELEEAATPLGCTSEISQDSGYEDTTTQSPVAEALPVTSKPSIEPSTVKNLVPVLVSVNRNGSLTLHDPNLSKFSGKVLVPENSLHFSSGIKVIPGTSLATVSQPLILSPVGRSPAQMIVDAPKSRPESILELLSPAKSDKNLNIPMSVSRKDISPSKGGKFKIGSFASISNTGLGKGVGTPIKNFFEDKPERVKPSATRSRSNSGKSSPACMESLDNLVQKVKGNLSQPPVLQSVMESANSSPSLDHIQHDHDYCTKNLMPSMVTSLLEQRLLAKDNLKPTKPIFYNKGRRDSESSREFQKGESRAGKRKRLSASFSKYDSLDSFDVDSESDTQSIPECSKSKSRYDKFLEKSRTTDPKVKITGSSNFQDQFVYFMNTTKRNRRRESRDSPLPLGNDRVFIPPKPGDIIVPHLTDQDIENLKQRSKLNKHSSAALGMNSLRNEFMAAKLANQQFSALPTSESAEDEKNIINTILSMENDESLSSPVNRDPPSYNESMELYGQGLGTDIMNLLPEQMNLTQEQMDLLYSAVDEVQNSSPALIEEKLVSPGAESQSCESLTSSFEPNNELVDIPNNISQGGVVEKTPSPLPSAPISSVGVEPTTENAPLELGDDASKVALKANTSDNSTHLTGGVTTTSAEVCASVANSTKDVTTGLDTQAHTDTEADAASNTAPVLAESTVQHNEESAIEVEKQASSVKVLPACAEKESFIHNTALGDSTLQSPDPSVNASMAPSTVPSSPESVNAELAPLNTKPEPSNLSTISDHSSSPNMLTVSDHDVRNRLPSLTNSVPADITTTQVSTSLTSDLSQLDILKNEFKLDSYVHSKSDIFNDSPAPLISQPSVASLLAQPTSFSVEYQAPWIVTVSMFWNDLPAIMISNQPYVRLVDIHKQILPAKDTGILKKRCQLMAIPVENCTEMQRYFIVQYGRAVNSKSTLIISLENAKELVGYYVNPQPKTPNPSDHKSIIEHRREQLRRIALAKRAAIRAQKPDKKDGGKASREHKDLTGSESVPDVVKTTEVTSPADSSELTSPVERTGSTTIGQQQPVPEAGGSQRATRHKKINFLEMLRGDSTGNADDDLLTEQVEKKPRSKVSHDTSDVSRKGKLPTEKFKVVRYSVELDSSEETDSVVSDYSSCYDTDSTSETDGGPLAQPPSAKQRKLMPPVAYQKTSNSNVKTYPVKSFMKNVKMKVRPNKSHPIATSTPVSVQVNRNGGFQQNGFANGREKNFLKVHYKTSSASLLGVRRKTFPESSLKLTGRSNGRETVVYEAPTQTFPLHKSVGVEMSADDLKVSPTLPDEILDSAEYSDSLTDEAVEQVGHAAQEFQSESSSVKENTGILKDENGNAAASSLTQCILNSVKTQVSTDDSRPALSLMKRKENIQISQDEVPLRIIHRDASPITEPRTRTQLGEVFVDRYHNKRSICVRCYTCRKMLSVDSFLRHLHDNTGMLVVTATRSLGISEGDLTETDRKTLGNEGLVYQLESETSHYGKTERLKQESPEKACWAQDHTNSRCHQPRKSKIVRSGRPKIVNTMANGHQETIKTLGPKLSGAHVAKVLPPEPIDGVRSSSRKRKLKQLYPFEEYSFAKFPRLNKNLVDNSEGN
ncbi:uncharacterized protein LOC127859788 [Dreissena polymorpha]|uniref:uncharacterized protein LOC127859788 n=1 Tax=Dreissena polymorpha TaxID=45954 RepID=UPI0022650019|nr:uncharacterized protein LOC127859788 [Dreissena polymorpha]